jgi:membrane protease YdiL (CAAX protease family)
VLRRILGILWDFIDWPVPNKAPRPALPLVGLSPAHEDVPITARLYDKRTVLLPLLILAVIIIGQFLLFTMPQTGVYYNQGALTLLLVIGLLSERVRQLALTVAILPIINAGVILFNQQQAIAQTVVLYELLLVLTLVYRHQIAPAKPHRVDRTIRLRYRTLVPLLLATALLLGLLEALLFGFGYTLTSDLVAPFIGLIVLAAIAEEVYFRGLLQSVAQKVVHPVAAILMTAGVYAIYGSHITEIWFVAFSVLSSCIISTVYYYKHNLPLSIALNLTIKLTIIGIVGRHFL